MRITGTMVSSTTLGEPVRAFVPHPLPPTKPSLAPESFAALNRNAELALARLSGVSGWVPSVNWLLYGAIRKEALLTSQVEGMQATLSDLFDEEAGFAVENTDDAAEVSNYLRAFRLVRHNLHDPAGLPISVRLLCDAHRVLLDGVGGTGKMRHSFRRRRQKCLFCWPIWSGYPRVAAKAGTAAAAAGTRRAGARAVRNHYPFLDGNGCIGRLLIAALVEHWGQLPEPLMYLSGYLKQHQAECYRRLSAIRDGGDWEG